MKDIGGRSIRALLCLSGLEGRRFVLRSLSLLPPDGLEVVLLYVADTRPAEELGYVRRALRRPGGPTVEADVDRAEDEVASEVLDEARDACLELGLPPSGVRAATRRGHPQHEIVEAARAEGVDVIVVGARHHGAALTGPKSVGPVARFVLDHAPCDVLLLRRQPV